jgi:hypothetical protein
LGPGKSEEEIGSRTGKVFFVVWYYGPERALVDGASADDSAAEVAAPTRGSSW